MTTEADNQGEYLQNRRFHGVYLLYCLNEARKGRTYIGYTVDPQRRIKQHNLGKGAGGAWKTDGKGPWEMVLIVHGFPNDVAGLRFEWAWQHPASSRRLKHVQPKRRSENEFEAKLRILAEMLRIGPWHRLPLTIQWLKQEYCQMFPVDTQPPIHMPIAYGPITVKNKNNKKPRAKEDTDCVDKEICTICRMPGNTREGRELLKCFNPNCFLISHATCIADKCKTAEFIVPITFVCPRCGVETLWANFIFGNRTIVESLHKATDGNGKGIITLSDAESLEEE